MTAAFPPVPSTGTLPGVGWPAGVDQNSTTGHRKPVYLKNRRSLRIASFPHRKLPKSLAFRMLYHSEFRSKPTGVTYYQYRYYDPMTGRWPSRDPIEERGGVNLCGFVKNRPTVRYDLFGLFTMPPPPTTVIPLVSNPVINAEAVALAQEGGFLISSESALASQLARATTTLFGAALTGLVVMSWELGLESVGLEKSLDQLDQLSEANRRSENLRRQSEEVKRKNEEDRRNRCEPCQLIGPLPRIGSFEHTLYASVLGTGEWKLVTADGKHDARYDSMAATGPGANIMIEAKVGHGFMSKHNSEPFFWAYPRLLTQFSNQEYVASICGYSYMIAVDNKVGAEALQAVFPGYPIRHISPGWH